jgi:pimeloyl-ACP methyl ester carboxylesterase
MAAPAVVEDKFVTLDGLRFHYRQWGREDAPPLVFLHGVTGHAGVWDRFAGTMSDQFRGLALDQRGHGLSDWAAAYSTELMAADLNAFARDLRLIPFTLVGHSMGGINSYVFAAKYPGSLRRLVIVDFGPDIASSPGSAVVRSNIQAAATAEFGDPEEAFRAARAANPRPSDADIRNRLAGALKQREDGLWVWRFDARGYFAAGAARRMFSPEEQWDLLKTIDCPTLLIRGAESDALSRESAEHMVAVIPDCRLIEVERAGHSVPLDNPEGFLAAVRPFLLENR